MAKIGEYLSHLRANYQGYDRHEMDGKSPKRGLLYKIGSSALSFPLAALPIQVSSAPGVGSSAYSSLFASPEFAGGTNYGLASSLIDTSADGVVAQNYVGYSVDTGKPFSGVQTKIRTSAFVDCPLPDSLVAFWAGFYDGTTGTIEQAGETVGCNAKREPYAFAWTEMYPRNPKKVNIGLRFGDELSVRINKLDGGSFEFTLKDENTGRSSTTIYACPVKSCPTETDIWTAETENFTPYDYLPTPDFYPAQYSEAIATKQNGSREALSSFSSNQITTYEDTSVMPGYSGDLIIDVTRIAPGGDFTVYRKNPTLPA